MGKKKNNDIENEDADMPKEESSPSSPGVRVMWLMSESWSDGPMKKGNNHYGYE